MSPALLCLLHVACAAAAPAWEVRYGVQADQKPEWTAAGYLPTWSLAWADRIGPEVTWTEPAPGRSRGWLLLGRPWRVPEPGPMGVTLSCEYRTRCALDEAPMKRSGELHAFACTVDAWRKLAASPAEAAVLTPNRADGFLGLAPIKPQGDDVPGWTASGPTELGGRLRSLAGQTVMVGLLWGGYHYSAVEEGGVRNVSIAAEDAQAAEKRFWDALDLARPELAPVRQALEAGDHAAAVKALAAHLRQREKPVVAHPVEPATDGRIKAAGEVLQHTYRLAGCPVYTFPGAIVWNADPFNYDQWAIALNRHMEWLSLAAAWLRTKDERYAREWQAQVVDWAAQMPVDIGPHWIEGPYNQAGRAPLSLDAGIRMGQSWFPAFEVLKRAPCITDDTLVTFARSAWQHAQYLMQPQNYKRGSNWGAMESNGLYHLGVLLPEFKDAPLWRRTAMARTVAEQTEQVYPDGAQTELAPGYHGVTLHNFLGVLELGRANGEPVPTEFEQGLERMYDYYLQAAEPDLSMPALNDSPRFNIARMFATAVKLFPQRPDFRWALTGRQEGQPPAYSSFAFPWAGWVIMRSGWGPDAAYLHFGAGPFGTGHQHEDKLGLIVYALGQELITEAGIYAYDTSAWRRYVLSTRGHSTVRMDGQDQSSHADRSSYRAARQDTHGFTTDANFDYARDTFSSGYGEPAQKTVVHRRRVLFVKPSYWVVVDDFAASDQREHTAGAQFLLNADGAEVLADGTVLSKPGRTGARIAVIPLEQVPAPRVVVGQKEPEVLGFLPEGFNKLRPVPAALYDTRFGGAATRSYALVPFKGDLPPCRCERREGGAVLIWPDGRQEVAVSGTRLVLAAPGRQFEREEPPLEAPK